MVFLITEFSIRKFAQSLVSYKSNANTNFRWYVKGGISPICSSLTTPCFIVLIAIVRGKPFKNVFSFLKVKWPSKNKIFAFFHLKNVTQVCHFLGKPIQYHSTFDYFLNKWSDSTPIGKLEQSDRPVLVELWWNTWSSPGVTI